MLVAKKTVAPWFPTRKKDFPRINRLAGLKPGQVFYDLGCGDARVCAYMAKHNPESKVVGVEVVRFLYLLARARKSFSKLDNLEIKLADVFSEDLSSADVIYTFAIIESINGKLKEKLKSEMKKGGKLISYAFSIEDWQDIVKVDDSSEFGIKINVYKK